MPGKAEQQLAIEPYPQQIPGLTIFCNNRSRSRPTLRLILKKMDISFFFNLVTNGPYRLDCTL